VSWEILEVIAGGDEEVVIRFRSQSDFLRFSRRFRFIDFANMFVDGHVDFEGSLERVVEIGLSLNERRMSFCEEIFEKLGPHVLRLLSRFGITTPSSLQNYGTNPRLYEKFLDKYMQYTCGLFESKDDDLDTANEINSTSSHNGFNFEREQSIWTSGVVGAASSAASWKNTVRILSG